jgi:hypothetical protein
MDTDRPRDNCGYKNKRPPMINSETPCFVGAFYLMLGSDLEYRAEAQDKLNAMITKMLLYGMERQWKTKFTTKH